MATDHTQGQLGGEADRAVVTGASSGIGAIINFSSGLAFSGGLAVATAPYRAVYAATRSFVNTFSQTLQDESAGTGVRVQAVCPGPVRTEFFAQAGANMDRFPSGVLMEPEAVVKASLAGLALGEVICVPALEDASLVTQAHVAQSRILTAMRRATLAHRYEKTGGRDE